MRLSNTADIPGTVVDNEDFKPSKATIGKTVIEISGLLNISNRTPITMLDTNIE